MNSDTPYNWRPLSTGAGRKQHPAKELLFFLIRASLKVVPDRIIRAFSRQLRLLREAGEYTTEKSPIEGMMIDSIEKVPDNESTIVSTLMASFRAAKQRQSDSDANFKVEGAVGSYGQT